MKGAVSIFVLAMCFAAPSRAYAQDAGDPLEGVNRRLFAIHDGVDRAILEPVARGYRTVTPEPVRHGVTNFLRNLRSPVIFANDVLQGELGRAGETAVRFGINSTIGVAGILDPAADVFERHDEDFGQTLAVWGVDDGPYLFVPLMGPSNVRDAAGRIVDIAFDPFSWGKGDDADTFRTAHTALGAVSTREQLIESVEGIRENSVDPYISLRTSYHLLRESAVQNGRAEVQDLPEFDDIPDVPEDTAPAPSGEGEAAFPPPDVTPEAEEKLNPGEMP
jgi:phospholipid-binding lipoprotein MlaA